MAISRLLHRWVWWKCVIVGQKVAIGGMIGKEGSGIDRSDDPHNNPQPIHITIS